MSRALDERFLDVNAHGVLRVPAALWAGFAVLARHWVLVLMVLVSVRRDASVLRVIGEDGVPWMMAGLQLPVVVLALAGSMRRPDAGAVWRWIWRWGPEIVAVTALVNVAWTARMLMRSDYWLPWPELFLGSCALIDVTIAVSLYTTPVMRQLFREFPPRPAKEAQP